MKKQKKQRKEKIKNIDYSDPKERKEILERQRRDIWTPEQISSFVKHFKLKPGMKLLDAGCGYGYCMRTYGPYCMPNGKLFGVDIEYNLLKTAKKYTKREGLGKASTFYCGDIYNLPFKKNTFDISVIQIVFSHLVKPEKALDELIRVTKRSGCIAIFENALSGGGGNYWSNIFKPTIKQRLFYYEVSLRSWRGKIKQGHGDFAVGCYMPAWMEQRGLKGVTVRQNERVHWIAPPYRSPDQKTELLNLKERYTEGKKIDAEVTRWISKRLRAGGADEKMIERYIRSIKRHRKLFKNAINNGTLAFATIGGFWCVWGFKP